MVRVLICGASIAGNALAYWLRRDGFEVTVVERAPAVREGGYAVDIRGVALEVADRMGIVDEARRRATDTIATSFVDRDGRRVATLPLGFGVLDPADIEIMKGDLTRVLHDAVPGGVEWIFGDTIAALRQHERGVEVELERAGARSFDYVVGADGIWSRVRALAFGPPERYVHHLGSNSAIFTAPNELGIERWQLIHSAPGRVASVKTDRGSREVKVTLLYGAPVPPRDREARVRSVEAAFAGAGWVVPRLLEAMRAAPDLYVAPNAQVRMPEWTTGRVALVGDAGYAPSSLTGQGSGMALVGAYLLSREIARAAGVPVAEPAAAGVPVAEPAAAGVPVREPGAVGASVAEPAAVGASVAEPAAVGASVAELATVGASVGEPAALGASVAGSSSAGSGSVRPSAGSSSSDLSGYNAALRHFVELNQRAALRPAKGFAPKTERAARLQALSIRMLPYMPWRGIVIAAMMRESRRAASALTLPPAA